MLTIDWITLHVFAVMGMYCLKTVKIDNFSCNPG